MASVRNSSTRSLWCCRLFASFTSNLFWSCSRNLDSSVNPSTLLEVTVLASACFARFCEEEGDWESDSFSFCVRFRLVPAPAPAPAAVAAVADDVAFVAAGEDEEERREVDFGMMDGF